MEVIVENIRVPEGRRPVDEDRLKPLMESIKQFGLMHPIHVWNPDDETLDLVAGRHRLEACRRLKWETIPCTPVVFDEIDRELWEISENLHRAELTALERSEQVARWLKLTEDKLNQLGSVSKGGRGKEGGTRASARDIGVSQSGAVRAQKIAKLTPEAKQAAKDGGVDDNQAALLAAASKPADEQEGEIQKQAQKRKKPASPPPDPDNDFEVISKQVTALMRAWNKAGPEARKQFLAKIDTPVFDNTKAA